MQISSITAFTRRAAASSVRGTVVWGVVAVSVRQRIVPAALIGRTMAVYRVAGLGLMSVGAAAGGYLAGSLSLRAPFLIGGAVASGTVALCWPMLTDRRCARRTGCAS